MDQFKQNQEQRVLDTIINNIPAMVFYKNLEGVYIAANEMFCNQLGTTPEKIAGKTDFDFYPRERAQKYHENDLAVIRTGISQEIFEEEINVNGVLKIFATRKVIVKDPDDNPSGIIGLVYDVTENHRIEHELEDSRTRYKSMYNMLRLMTDNIPDLLWAKDLKKRFLFVNKAICEKLLNATDTDEPIGKTDLFFAERERNSHPEDPRWHTFGEICMDSDELTMQQKSAGCFNEFGNVKGQFLYLDVQKAPIIDEEGNMIGTVGSGRDITKQKLMEQEFQALFQRNQAIIEALPDLMFIFDDQGTFIECYVSNTKDLLVPPALLIGRTIDDFFEPAIALKTREMIHRCLQSKTIQTFEYDIIFNSSKQYYEARLIHVETNKVLCISRNITDRKNLQHELIIEKERAEESSRLKTTLLNNMSHEIRTPLNGILGFSEIMSNELSDRDFVDMACHINNSGKRLMKTLESVMQLSQLEAGINNTHPAEIDIVQSIRQLTESFLPRSASKNLTLEFRETNIKPGFIDSFFLLQAVSNIIDNALKFTINGGITIDIHESKKEENRWVTICIADTGIGISEEQQNLIFEEFRQVSEGQNRNFEGTGLGLTVAKKMIKLLGGDIWVESIAGTGSKFSIVIPFPENNTVENGAPEYTAPYPFPTIQRKTSAQEKQQILLVEDNEINCQLAIVYLRDHYRIDTSHDGPSTLQMIDKKQYDAILMDINLGPGMDGLQTTSKIRMQKGYETTPIIALTGYTLFGDRDRMIAGGCSAYLPKPFTKTDILNVLEQVLNP